MSKPWSQLSEASSLIGETFCGNTQGAHAKQIEWTPFKRSVSRCFFIWVVPLSIKPRLLAVMGISFSQSNAFSVLFLTSAPLCMFFLSSLLLVLRTFLLILGASKSYDQIISSESSSYFPRSEKTWPFSSDSGQPISLLVLMSLLKVLTIAFISFQ